MRKVIGGGEVVVACRIIVSAPVPFLFFWTLDFGFGTGLGLDNIKILFLNLRQAREAEK